MHGLPRVSNCPASLDKTASWPRNLFSTFLALPYLSFGKTVLVCIINLIQAHAPLFTGHAGLTRDFGGKVTVSNVSLAGRTACAKLYLCRAVPLKILGPVL